MPQPSRSIVRAWVSAMVLPPILLGLTSCDRSSRAAVAQESRPTEVTWLVSVGPDRPMVDQLLARFAQLHPDIAVRPMWVPSSQYQLKLKTLIAAGKPPDIFWSGDVWMGYERPFLADVSGRVRRDAAELDLDDFYPERLAACRYEGRQLLLPRWFNVALLYYNKKIFDDAHEPYPTADWTWDDYIAAAKRLTKRDAKGNVDVWGSTVTPGWWGEWLIYVRQSG